MLPGVESYHRQCSGLSRKIALPEVAPMPQNSVDPAEVDWRMSPQYFGALWTDEETRSGPSVPGSVVRACDSARLTGRSFSEFPVCPVEVDCQIERSGSRHQARQES